MGRKKRGKSARNAQRNQQPVQEEEYKKAPHSFVFPRGHVGKNIRELIRDVRRVMEPYTATHLQAGKKNVLKDYVNVAGLLHVSHFLVFSKTEVSTNLRIARLPKGPTLTFKVNSYCLDRDLISTLKRPNMEQKQFINPPLLVMNNFGGESLHTKLMSTMFQNMFPSININKVKLNSIRRCVLLNYDPDTKTVDFRHYNIRIVPVGMSRSVKKLIQAKVPDMGKLSDISEYVTKDGNLSESEAELDGPDNEVVVPQRLSSRGNIKSAKSAVRLTELGPRMSLQLVKIEEGMCGGQVMFHQFIQKTAEEMEVLKHYREKRRELKEIRREQQARNVKRKQKEKEDHKMKSLEGMKNETKGNDIDSGEDSMDDADYYRQEVGQEPDPELFPKVAKRKMPHQAGPRHKKMKKFTDRDTKNTGKMQKRKGSGVVGARNIKYSKDKKFSSNNRRQGQMGGMKTKSRKPSFKPGKKQMKPRQRHKR